MKRRTNLNYLGNPVQLKLVRGGYMTQIRDDSTFTSNGVTTNLKYFDHNFVAFEARDLILSYSENSAITNF